MICHKYPDPHPYLTSNMCGIVLFHQLKKFKVNNILFFWGGGQAMTLQFKGVVKNFTWWVSVGQKGSLENRFIEPMQFGLVRKK